VREIAVRASLLSAKDELLALALAQGKTRKAAGLACSVAERTVYLKLSRQEFQLRVQELRGEMLGRAVARLTASAETAAETLQELLGAGMPPTVRLGAARAVLAELISLAYHEGVEARLAELESRLKAGPRALPAPRVR